MTGRPTDFTEALVETICARMADGESLRKICRDDAMPNRETVRRWLKINETFSGQYARAREERADYFADEVIEIANNTELDPSDKRVRIDAHKWTACHMDRATYGDKASVDVSGGLEITKIVREVVDSQDQDS